jgi:hypothetical protein
VIGLADTGDLHALATSFEDITSSSKLGSEYKPIVLMKWKNTLRRETGLPEDMKELIALADVIKFLHGSHPAQKCGSSRDADTSVYHRPQEPSVRCSTNNVNERACPHRKQSRPSGIYRSEDLAHFTPKRGTHETGGESDDGGLIGYGRTAAWGVLPPLTSVKDAQHREGMMTDEIRPVGPGAAGLTSEAEASELKVRGAMMKSAVKDLSPWSGKLQWKAGAVTCFALAGRRMALEENFKEKAADDGWPVGEIADANQFVWALLHNAAKGTKSAIVFAKAPVFDGARAWWELRRKHEVLGRCSRRRYNSVTFCPLVTSGHF